MSSEAWMMSREQAEANLPDDPDGFRFWYAMRRGTMKMGLYAPRKIDPQGPHSQDELYVIISGTGDFVNNGDRRQFAPQDVLFVAAGAEHRFENFSEDFAAWVIFWGPLGGELKTAPLTS